MFSKYERQKDKRTYEERLNLFTGPQFLSPPERIRPSKIVRWNDEGLPIYGEPGEAPPAHAAVNGTVTAEDAADAPDESFSNVKDSEPAGDAVNGGELVEEVAA